MNRTTLKLAAAIDAQLTRGYTSYLEQCDYDRSQGHRPHYCEHGTSNWTDYDNICGWCEESISMGNPQDRMQEALSQAKSRWANVVRIMDAWQVLRDLNLNEAVNGDEIAKKVGSLLTV